MWETVISAWMVNKTKLLASRQKMLYIFLNSQLDPLDSMKWHGADCMAQGRCCLMLPIGNRCFISLLWLSYLIVFSLSLLPPTYCFIWIPGTCVILTLLLVLLSGNLDHHWPTVYYPTPTWNPYTLFTAAMLSLSAISTCHMTQILP